MDSAEVVIVGGGTIGAWCAHFLAEAGVGRIVLVEAATLGQGASSRAAGMIRAQGGTETAVRLGMFSRDFYAAQTGIDSGFVAQGYLMPCFTETEVGPAHERIAMQQALGLDVTWLDPPAVESLSPTMAAGVTLGASYAPGDGYLEPPRNVLAYTVALTRAGVDVRERTEFTGLTVRDGSVAGVSTAGGDIATQRVVLTGGPVLAEVGRRAGVTIPAGGVRHQVVVTAPHQDFAPDRLPMGFDLASGLYWRPHEGGLMWGMSNPAEEPGEATSFDWDYYNSVKGRMAALLPAVAGLGLRRVWAATIDYTPDHLPIVGSVPGIAGVTVASAGGHGMMWGPGVARVAADLTLTGRTEVVDVADLGLDRFDADGRSRLAADPVALPFPAMVSS